jgi:hypothetical protein
MTKNAKTCKKNAFLHISALKASIIRHFFLHKYALEKCAKKASIKCALGKMQKKASILGASRAHF